MGEWVSFFPCHSCMRKRSLCQFMTQQNMLTPVPINMGTWVSTFLFSTAPWEEGSRVNFLRVNVAHMVLFFVVYFFVFDLCFFFFCTARHNKSVISDRCFALSYCQMPIAFVPPHSTIQTLSPGISLSIFIHQLLIENLPFWNDCC